LEKNEGKSARPSPTGNRGTAPIHRRPFRALTGASASIHHSGEASMNRWFYSRKGQLAGPFTLEQLQGMGKEGKLLADDLVWQEGSPQWLPASGVPGLLPAPAAPAPAPPPPKPAPPPPVAAPVVKPVVAQAAPVLAARPVATPVPVAQQ